MRRSLPIRAALAGASLAAVAFALVGPARAAVCEIPRALLCPGCASDIRVLVTPAGHCRVSFTPGGSEAPLRLTVTTSPPARRLARAAPASPRLWRPGLSERCFTAGGRRYCE